MESRYTYEYDDPYKILAHAVIGFYRPADVLRMLVDNEYLLNCIVKEVRSQDIGGSFLDCIIEDVLADKKRMEYMHELDKLALYFYKKLNKERLRKEISVALSEVGIEIDYSTEGSVSSAST